MEISPLYWQILFWIIQLLIILPLSIFLAFRFKDLVDRRSQRIAAATEGEWKSSFMLNQNDEWIDQDVIARRKWYRKRIHVWSEGGEPGLGWRGYLEVHNDILVGAWENVTNPLISGAQSLSIQFLTYEAFVVGATTGSNKELSKAIRVSTWVMARNSEDLMSAKAAVRAEIR